MMFYEPNMLSLFRMSLKRGPFNSFSFTIDRNKHSKGNDGSGGSKEAKDKPTKASSTAVESDRGNPSAEDGIFRVPESPAVSKK